MAFYEYSDQAEEAPLAKAVVYKQGSRVIAKKWNDNLGRWQRIAQGKAGVDDVRVMQSAIEYGGIIYILKSEYILYYKLLVENKDNVYLVGVGRVILKTVGSIRLIEVVNSSNFRFENFVCDFNNNGLDILIHRTTDFANNVYNIVIKNIEKTNQNVSDARGIVVWDEDNAMGSYGVYNVVIENIYTHDNKTAAGEEVELAGVRSGVIRNVWAVNNNRPSVALYLCKNCKIENVWTDQKIWISGVNCSIKNAYMFGDYPLELRSCYDIHKPSYNLYAKDCYLTGTKEIRINADSYDIYNVVIDHCYVIDSIEEGIIIEGTGKVYNPIISGCYIIEAASDGISVSAENYNLKIHGCYISKNGVDGIRLLAGNDTIIEKCVIKNNQQKGIGSVGVRNRGINTHILYCDIYDDQPTPTQTTFLRNEAGNVLLMFGGMVTGSLVVEGGSINKIVDVMGYTTENHGTATITGDGTTTTFNIPHGLVSTPSFVMVTPKAGAPTPSSIDWDDTNIILTFATAPATGTYYYAWEAKV